MATYSESFYKIQQSDSRKSAQVVVPLIIDMINPRSVVDVGCGVGTWLGVFRESGVQDIQGIDGHYVNQSQLHIPPTFFKPANLEEPIQLDKRFDLAMSLEVAEHLHSDKADQFVASLCQLAPVVMFSAAIPHQGGTGHINEQWQDYWAAKFKSNGYVPVDAVRRKIWNNDNVSCHYAENTLIYVREEQLGNYPKLAAERALTEEAFLCLVHPKKYLEQCDPNYISMRVVSDWIPKLPKLLFSRLPKIVVQAISNRLPG